MLSVNDYFAIKCTTPNLSAHASNPLNYLSPHPLKPQNLTRKCRSWEVKLKGLFAAFLPASDEFGQIPAWIGKFCAGILAPSFSDGLSEEALQHPAEQQEKSRAHRSSSRLRKGREAA